MKNSFTISVPEPCSEKWDNFTPTAKGGFCAGCQKEVIDFTTWSDDKIKLYFAQHAQKPCGRFRPDQLKQYIPETHRAGINPWLPASVISVLLLGSHTAEAQVTTCTTPPTEEYARIGEVLLKPTEDSQRNIYREIHGTVKEAADGSLLPGINVILKGTEQGTVTDAEGKFTLRSNDLSRNSVLVFSFIGYETQEISLSSYSRQSEIVIDLNMDATVLGGVEIYYRHRWSPRAIWWKIKNIFR